MHTNLILLLLLYSSILVIKLLKVVLSQNSHCNTTGQSSFISLATCMACPL